VNASPPSAPVASRREIFAWCLYDWANSAYSTISITVLVTYLKSVWVGDSGNRAWGWSIGVSALVVAVLSPVLGAWADARAAKRWFLAVTALAGATAAMLMFFATPDRPWLLLILFWIVLLGFELAYGFSNSFLPELASPERMNTVSGWGFALGYVGGALALIGFLVLFQFGHHLGLPQPGADPTGLLPRLGLLGMGIWWGVFSLPAVFWLRDRSPPRGDQPLWAAARQALREVRGTLANIRRYRMLALFLAGFLFYNDGVQTAITQASVFATDALHMDSGELALLVLMIQFMALPGAMLIGYLGDRYGGKPVLIGCLLVWIGLLVAARVVETKTQFWIMGAVLALVMGGTQSVSRALMGLMTPTSRSAEFFGFFNLSGKAFSIAGPILFSEVTARTGDARLATSSLLVFFVLGLVFISRVNVDRGRRDALEPR
jgi:MFS transporter, UMF1 family